MTHGNHAGDVDVEFWRVVEHGLIPARVRQEWSRSRLRKDGILSVWVRLSYLPLPPHSLRFIFRRRGWLGLYCLLMRSVVRTLWLFTVSGASHDLEAPPKTDYWLRLLGVNLS